MKTLWELVVAVLALLVGREVLAQAPRLCEGLIRFACRLFPAPTRGRFEREYLGDLGRTEGAELARLLAALKICLWAVPRAADARTGGGSSAWLASLLVGWVAGVTVAASAGYALLFTFRPGDGLLPALALAAGLGYLAAVAGLALFFCLLLRVAPSALGRPAVGWAVRVACPPVLVVYVILGATLLHDFLASRFYMMPIIHQYMDDPLRVLVGPLRGLGLGGASVYLTMMGFVMLSLLIYLYVHLHLSAALYGERRAG